MNNRTRFITSLALIISIHCIGQHPDSLDLKLNNDRKLIWKDINGTWRGQISALNNNFRITPMGQGQALNFGDGTSGVSDTWFSTVGTENPPVDATLMIKAGGNIGIGTNSPDEKLEISGNILLQNTDKINWRDTNGNIRGQIGPVSNAFRITPFGTGQSLYFGDGTSGNSDTWFSTTAETTPKTNVPFIVKASGNIGINTNAPSATLEISATRGAGTGFVISDPGDSNNDRFWFQIALDGSSLFKMWNQSESEVIRLDSDGNTFLNGGNVGIGNTTPNFKGYANGSVLSVGGNYAGILELASNLNSNTIGRVDFFSTAVSKRLASIVAFKSSNEDSQLRFYTKPTEGSMKEALRIDKDGDIGIGITNPTSKLHVDGNIIAEEVKIQDVTGADFVFKEDYDLKPLSEVEKYISENGHLPDIPSASEMKENGVQMGELNMKLLQKIEELTLYTIDLKKENEELKSEINLIPKAQSQTPIANSQLAKQIEELTLYVLELKKENTQQNLLIQRFLSENEKTH